jgi:hypothetical protein
MKAATRMLFFRLLVAGVHGHPKIDADVNHYKGACLHRHSVSTGSG